MSNETPACVEDVHAAALAMPHVTVERPGTAHPVYRVGSKSFVFFRTPRPDAVDPTTGERWDDVIVLWVAGAAKKEALVQSDGPFFSTPHFDGHASVLVRASRLGETSRGHIIELVEDAWLAQASKRRGQQWLASQGQAG